ncbi:hypothetical protein J2X11_002799 [Aeromicrobium panaciterrae]|uniref:Uncharacterized protein n=1 Tax=Aeromicrobium panaciterrae TaxID=363861 RepID=A0ABU1US04_9ACTN|nr:hypothetical protein [Aeromicrobium panaciterrae]MDR7087960.1 hypothetical protein [Aeromicrobium panaciterrae]
MDPSEDLMTLQEIAREQATIGLEETNSFDPFGLAMLMDGEVALVVDNDGLDGNESIRGFLTGLSEKRDELRAVAIVADVSVLDGGDAIRMTLEHRGDLAMEIVIPYSIPSDRGIEYGDVQMGRGPRFIWPEPEAG